MNILILVVDDAPDVIDLFRQPFRRELRAGRFEMASRIRRPSLCPASPSRTGRA